jgi:non-homologous end joining protein Ku
MKVRITKDRRYAQHRDGYRHACPNSGSEVPDLMAALQESLGIKTTQNGRSEV